MKTHINKIDIDWIDVKNKCRTTVNKDHSKTEATSSFKKKLLLSEHSPMRLLRINWIWRGIKSWVATHYVRHHVGIEKWVSTQRSDRINKNRDEIPQGALVDMEMEGNSQSLINMGRVRLCYQASPETREYMEDLKLTLHNEKETLEIADVLVPNCIYRCGCPEFQECGYWKSFHSKYHSGLLLDIQSRYDVYNKEFYERMNELGKTKES